MGGDPSRLGPGLRGNASRAAAFPGAALGGSARRAREHTDCNVLSMGAWAIGRGAAVEVLRAFREAEFEGGRHERRVGKVNAIDDRMRRETAATGPSA